MDMTLFRNATIEFVNQLNRNTMGEQIGIEITEIGSDYLRGRMPVDKRTIQPYGILHGGASAALAETLGSIAGTLVLDPDKEFCVGLEINANHIRSGREGFVYGTARPIHIGGRTQVWEIRIEDELQSLICISRLTLAVLPRKRADN